MSDLRTLLAHAAELGSTFREGLPARTVRATASTEELKRTLGRSLPVGGGVSAREAIDILSEAAGRGTVASAGPRYFGFVTGGSTPAALAADWLVSAWDQNAALHVMSPLVSAVEEVTASWLREIVGLPSSTSVGFVTGCQMANFTALAAARHRVLRDAGWDVEADGLRGSPDLEIFIGEEAHYTVSLALRMLGFGSRRLKRIAADAQGRMRPDELARALRTGSGPCIVCAQAGNVNTGAFDPDERTRRVIACVQDEGTCWCGGTTWHGRAAMRISISNWSTRDEDIERSLEAVMRCARMN